ncbi:MAG: glycine--tRNA ligase [Chloroflexi bacterium]|nr:glycine--tRNA ligase [Chloroflexota bacterium]
MVRSLEKVDMDKIVSLCKRRGFIFQSSEIYGGLGSTWDYGPMGVELKRNVKDAWWRSVVWERDDMVGLDAAILMHPRVWKASGHLEGFVDPLVECSWCHRRFRADHLVAWDVYGVNRGSEWLLGQVADVDPPNNQPSQQVLYEITGLADKGGFGTSHYKISDRPIEELIMTGRLPCPVCRTLRTLSPPRNFNLMLKTFLGPVEDTASTVYMRPETAQGIFVNFQNVLTATRRKLPFGIAQIGKAFRNEITPGNFVFRTREFEQMEIEFFVKPGTDEEWHQRWVQERLQWYVKLGIRQENLRLRRHGKDELAHYAKDCYDIDYRFPWGWAELEGIANRTDFDLKAHSAESGLPLAYFDEETKEHVVPYVIEPSGGADRAALAFLIDAYDEEPDPGQKEIRTVLHLHPSIAPVKVAVLPLSRNERLVPTARQVYDTLRSRLRGLVQYDDAQSIGRRYRRQDEIGTPFCVTIDFQSLEDNAVTIRDRDTMAQVRVPIAELADALAKRLEGQDS